MEDSTERIEIGPLNTNERLFQLAASLGGVITFRKGRKILVEDQETSTIKVYDVNGILESVEPSLQKD